MITEKQVEAVERHKALTDKIEQIKSLIGGLNDPEPRLRAAVNLSKGGNVSSNYSVPQEAFVPIINALEDCALKLISEKNNLEIA